MSPTQRTLAELRKRGYTAYVVERWNPHAKIRQDLFGFIDILGMRPGEPLLAIQATSAGNVNARVTKIMATPLSQDWISTGSRLEVWGWAKRGAKGKRKLWTLTIKVIAPGRNLHEKA
ncbi:MAG: hypothetical protein OEW25_01010 [Nitrospira sp.]|nr:hypothetical protein [Nitrospira sp.]